MNEFVYGVLGIRSHGVISGHYYIWQEPFFVGSGVPPGRVNSF